MNNVSLAVVSSVFLYMSNLTAEEHPPSLWHLVDTLRTKTFVDLTHAFDRNIPYGPGLTPASRQTLFYYDEGVGSVGSGGLVHLYTHVGQWGTHVDPPAHFIRGLRLLDQIPVSEMVMPLVILDVHEQAAANPDYEIRMDDVKHWEQRYGPIPEGAFVAMRTDWSKRWPDTDRFFNRDASGIAHYPGWSREVLQYLYEERHVTASGHETPDTDSGLVASHGEYPLETFLLSHDHYQIEMLDHLDLVPEYGAIVVASWPKPKFGSGFPARVFAILP